MGVIKCELHGYQGFVLVCEHEDRCLVFHAGTYTLQVCEACRPGVPDAMDMSEAQLDTYLLERPEIQPECSICVRGALPHRARPERDAMRTMSCPMHGQSAFVYACIHDNEHSRDYDITYERTFPLGRLRTCESCRVRELPDGVEIVDRTVFENHRLSVELVPRCWSCTYGPSSLDLEPELARAIEHGEPNLAEIVSLAVMRWLRENEPEFHWTPDGIKTARYQRRDHETRLNGSLALIATKQPDREEPISAYFLIFDGEVRAHSIGFGGDGRTRWRYRI